MLARWKQQSKIVPAKMVSRWRSWSRRGWRVDRYCSVVLYHGAKEEPEGEVHANAWGKKRVELLASVSGVAARRPPHTFTRPGFCMAASPFRLSVGAFVRHEAAGLDCNDCDLQNVVVRRIFDSVGRLSPPRRSHRLQSHGMNRGHDAKIADAAAIAERTDRSRENEERCVAGVD